MTYIVLQPKSLPYELTPMCPFLRVVMSQGESTHKFLSPYCLHGILRDGWGGYSPQDWEDFQNANLYWTQPANIEPSTGSSLPTTVQSLSSSSLTATATPSLFTSSGPKPSQSRSFSVSIDPSPPLSTTTPVKQSTGVVPLCSCSAVKGPGPVVPSRGYSM